MTKRKGILLLLVSWSFLLFLTGCISEALGMRGNPTPVQVTRTPMNTPTPQSNNPGVSSTRGSPVPTSPPVDTVIPTSTITPTPDIQATVQAQVAEILAQTPEVTPTVTPTPGPTLTPTPTPRYRPIQREDTTLGAEGFEFTSGPDQPDHFSLKFTAHMDRNGLEPTQIQVFQALNFDDSGGDCSTEKPIAFVFQNAGFGSVHYPWTYCPYLGSPTYPCGSSTQGCSRSNPESMVPLINAKVWNYTERTVGEPNSRRNPIRGAGTFDWTVEIDFFEEELVRDRMYSSPAGFVLVIFSEETLLARIWIDAL